MPARTDASGSGPSEFVILTGMSGAGRSTVANVMEDQGWYVVDNLPPQLLPDLARLGHTAADGGAPARVAAVVDVRAGALSEHWQQAFAELRSDNWAPRLIFLDATDESLVRRFESVRRPHPLQGHGRLLDGIQRERAQLADLRSVADLVIDTSGLNVHQLARKIMPIFGAAGGQLRLAVMSFGFKYGVPLDSDFVFDLRFLPNPFWVPELRALTGRDAAVSTFVLDQPGAGEFVTRVGVLLEPVRAGYAAEGRRYATLAVGCTGGKHRSVAIAEELAATLASETVTTFVVHRDLGQE